VGVLSFLILSSSFFFLALFLGLPFFVSFIGLTVFPSSR
jgi:hypothetical protein